MYLVKMIPGNRSEFRIGKGHAGGIDTIIHSDTLFGAICNNYRKLYGKEKLENFIENIKKERKIRFSSCFHALDTCKIKDGKEECKNSIYFFPKPRKKLNLNDESEENKEKNPKSLKKIEFVSKGVIEKIQNNEEIEFNDDLIIDEQYLICKKDYEKLGLTPYLNDNDEKKKRLKNCLDTISIYKIIEEQKVNVDRTLEVSDTFLAPKMQLQKSKYFVKNKNGREEFVVHSLFYFLLECGKTPGKELKAAIRLIADEGIGGDRSIGCGLFEKIDFEYLGDKPHKNRTENGRAFMNLSLIFPEWKDFENIESFNLIDRTSFISSFKEKSYMSKKVRLIEEGSIFRDKVKGDLVSVGTSEFEEKNHHHVYKNGLGFYLPVGDLNE